LVTKASSQPTWPTKSSIGRRYLRKNVQLAIKSLKCDSPSLFQYRWAINVADEYLRTCSPNGTNIGLTYLKVGNRYSSSDLRDYLEKPENIFRQYFEYAVEQLTGPTTVSKYLISLVVIDQ